MAKASKGFFFSISWKIKLGFVGVILLMISMILGIFLLNSHFNTTRDRVMVSLFKANLIQSSFDDLTNLISQSVSAKTLSTSLDNMKSEVTKKNDIVQSSLKYLNDDKKSLASESITMLGSIASMAETYSASVNELIEKQGTQSQEELLAQVEVIASLNNIMIGEVRKFLASQLTHSEEVSKVIAKQYVTAIEITIGIVFAVLTATLVFAFNLSSRISKPIVALTNFSKEIANGNLKQPDLKIKTNDELKILSDTFNVMKNNLSDIIRRVEFGATNMMTSASHIDAEIHSISVVGNQVAQSTSSIAESAENQVKSFVNTSKDIRTIFETLSTTDLKSKIILDLSNQSIDIAKENVNTIENFTKEFISLSNTMKESCISIERFNQKISEIDSIIKVIQGMSSQTSLLSLNASIEAARAGEAGRGFSVVATEIKKLAMQSTDATEKISSTISNIIHETGLLTKSIQNDSERIMNAREMFDVVNSAFSNINRTSSSLNFEITEITALINNVVGGVSRLDGSISDLDDMNQSTAAGTQEIAASTQEQQSTVEQIVFSMKDLVQEAQKLEGLIKEFQH